MRLGHPGPSQGSPEPPSPPPKEAPSLCMPPDSLGLEEVAALGMFTEIIHFS